MTAWLWLLIGLWLGMGLGMAASTFAFMPTVPKVYLEKDIKSPQRLLAEWAERQ